MPTHEFNKRDVGLKLITFLQVFTITICSIKKVTLESLAFECEELQHGLTITKQALQKRLYEGKKSLELLLAATIITVMTYKIDEPTTVTVLNQFSAVLITDATTISLPEKLEEYHKGLGGTNAKSAMKIQATYDIKTKCFRKISLRDNATESDCSYMDELIKDIKPNELYINDLGYYSVAHFIKIDEKGAYFISKIKSNTILYAENGSKISIARKHKRSNYIDEIVTIKGSNKKSMKVRLCGIKLPPKVYDERIRKARKASKSGLTKEKIERLKWILIVTNVSEDMLDNQAVCEIYRIRWTIELIFKTWKSHFSIDKMNNIGKDYWDCLILGRLIVITMLTALHSKLHFLVLQTSGRGVSFLRFMKHMSDSLDKVMDLFTYKISDEEMIITINRVIRFSLIEKRKRKTTEETIAGFDMPSDCINLISDLAV